MAGIVLLTASFSAFCASVGVAIPMFAVVDSAWMGTALVGSGAILVVALGTLFAGLPLHALAMRLTKAFLSQTQLFVEEVAATANRRNVERLNLMQAVARVNAPVARGPSTMTRREP